MLSIENMNSTFVVEKEERVEKFGIKPTQTQGGGDVQILVETLKRNYEITESFSECQQVSNQMQRTTDVNLICSDGIIPVHAAILQAVSPFFDKIFTLHGPHYLDICSVLLPDYTVCDFKKVVELIYHGKTIIPSVLDGENVKEILSYFEIKISSIELYQPEANQKQTEVKSVLTFPLSPYDTESVQTKKERSEHLRETKSEDAAAQRKNLRPRDNLKKITAGSQTDSDSDYDIETAESEKRRAKRAKMGKKQTGDTRNLAQQSGSNTIVSHGRNTMDKTKNPGTSEKSRTVSDSSEDEMDDLKDADMGWFLNESKRCQYCGSQCKTAAAASICLTSHSRLRCYYCFKVVRNTEKLFQHFAKKHKQAGRENCLMCPFCEQTIPYKSVSCHVISMHLSNPATNKNKNDGNRRAITTTAAGASLQNHINLESKKEQQPSGSGSFASSSKKRKLPNQGDKSSYESDKEIVELNPTGPEPLKLHKPKNGIGSDDEDDRLMVRDLNTVIRRQSILSGKIRVFTLKKLRKLNDSDLV